MKLAAWSLAVAFLVTASLAFADTKTTSKLPEEPPLPNLLTDTGGPEDIYKKVYYNTLLGLLYIEFDLNGDEIVDYITARRIIETNKEYTDREIYDKNAPSDKFAESENAKIENFIYTVKPYPFFYWYKPPGAASFQQWIDQEEDGINDNETRYDIYNYSFPLP